MKKMYTYYEEHGHNSYYILKIICGDPVEVGSHSKENIITLYA